MKGSKDCPSSGLDTRAGSTVSRRLRMRPWEEGQGVLLLRGFVQEAWGVDVGVGGDAAAALEVLWSS